MITLNFKDEAKEQRRSLFAAHRAFYRQDGKTEKLEAKKEEQKLPTEEKQAEEASQKENERIAKSIHIKHLIASYGKVGTLRSLCRDFETPVFGDFPGNEAEMNVIKNLVHFLKEEINKMKFVSGEESEKVTYENDDPILRSCLPLIKVTISELEKKLGKLIEEKEDFDKLDREAKSSADELEEKIKEAEILKTDVEGYDTRMDKLKERQKMELKNNEIERAQYGQEMEEINKIHVHSLHENLRMLQERIGREIKVFNETKKDLKNLKELNHDLRARVSEAVAKNDNFKKVLAEPTEPTNSGHDSVCSRIKTQCSTH